MSEINQNSKTNVPPLEIMVFSYAVQEELDGAH
jgi:hypothetical protein